MRLSTKGRYAVTAMLDLAIHYDEGPVALAEVSEAQGISLSYLEQLFVRLKKGGLVIGLRGPGGGYRLAHSPDSISVAQVIDAIGEGIDVMQCGGNENCQDGEQCLTHALWYKLGNEIHNFLNDITLAGFLSRERVNALVSRQKDARAIAVNEPSLKDRMIG